MESHSHQPPTSTVAITIDAASTVPNPTTYKSPENPQCQSQFRTTMKPILVLVSLLLFNSLLPCYSLEDDVACLEGVKSSLTDPEGRLGQWDLASRSVASICKLVGVSCWNEKENRLISLQLPSMELAGKLPESLRFCHSLQNSVTLSPVRFLPKSATGFLTS